MSRSRPAERRPLGELRLDLGKHLVLLRHRLGEQPRRLDVADAEIEPVLGPQGGRGRSTNSACVFRIVESIEPEVSLTGSGSRPVPASAGPPRCQFPSPDEGHELQHQVAVVSPPVRNRDDLRVRPVDFADDVEVPCAA